MSSDQWAVEETMLTLTNNSGEIFTVVKLVGGEYGIVYPARPTGHRCGNLTRCINLAVKLAGINLDPR